MSFDALDLVRRHLDNLRVGHEIDHETFVCRVGLAEGVNATISLADGPPGGLLIAELALLSDTADDLRAALPLASWTPEHWFIKFCRYDSGTFVARTELLASHLDAPELGAALTALYDALALAPDAQRLIGGQPRQAPWDPDVALRRLDDSPPITPSELLQRIGDHLTAGKLPAAREGDHFALRTADDIAVTVAPADEGRVVSITAVLACDVDLDDPRAAQLLQANGGILFGGLGIRQEDRTLILEHDLVAATLDAPELATALAATAATLGGFGAYFANLLGRPPALASWDTGSFVGGPSTGWDLRPGERVGEYEIEDELGSGAFGTVYRAKDPQLPRSVAVKVLKPEWVAEPDIQARFLREAQLAARVPHPHLVKVHTLGQDGDLFYVVYDFVDGDPIERLLADEGRLAPDRVVRLVQQVAGALQALHDEGALHRDIKPANVMVWRPGSALEAAIVLDLGVAHADDRDGTRLTQLGAPGTLLYQGPEVAGALEDMGPALDQYALALTAYQMLAGVVPFTATTLLALHEQKLAGRLLRFRDVGADLDDRIEAVLFRALDPDPARRYPSVEAFADALAEAVHAGRIAVTPPETLAAPTEPAPSPPAAEPAPRGAAHGALRPYREWPPRPAPDPLSGSLAELSGLLLEIVQAESPVVSERAFRHLLAASGRKQLSTGVARRLSGAARQLARKGLIRIEEEWDSRDARDRILYTPDGEVVARELGPRRLDEVPPRELVAVAKAVAGTDRLDVDDLPWAEVLAAYDRRNATGPFMDRLIYAVGRFG